MAKVKLSWRHLMPAPGNNPHQDTSIGDHALIGDCRSAALVSRQGSIDWLCWPQFSSPSIFAAILDEQRGGRFSIQPTQPFTVERRYVGPTAVLETVFTTGHGVARVMDLMPVLDDFRAAAQLQPMRELLRLVEVMQGTVELKIVFEPRPDYGRARPRLNRRGALGWACAHGSSLLMLHTDLKLAPSAAAAGRLEAVVSLVAGDRRTLSLSFEQYDVGVLAPLGDAAGQRLAATLGWWENWAGQCSYDGVQRERVLRSVLTLKLLSYAPSGALVAAPTTSLPERIGGSRNWDYRYCWLRDASLTFNAFTDLGFAAEGEAFLSWMLHATRLT